MNGKLDITPSPRILRTLGEIPFQPWQCLAELIDNSIDAFSEAETLGIQIKDKQISISWSSENVGPNARSIEIVDTGMGMSIDTLQNAVRAGYSSNDPINHLGLFGMGFNIATARLGDKTRIISTTQKSDCWEGIEINFAKLISNKSYLADYVSEPKKNRSLQGTKIVVSNLKGDTFSKLRDQETQIRRQLENIYSAILDKIDVEIFVQGKRLKARKYCIWNETRCVYKDGKTCNAVIRIDKDLGETLFDVSRNAYLKPDEIDEFTRGENIGDENKIIYRKKRLHGWIGIQRYADTNDFGIDFIRNGRKILIANKELFSWTNPLTGTTKLEYPVELGSTVGGRIVGEIHVDYLLPTYQKNDFDRNDISWIETIEELRGIGPILPQERKLMGYSDPNTSPIGQLATFYRRVDPGTKCLYVDKQTSKELLAGFNLKSSEYLSDELWWRAAQEADKRNAANNAQISPDVDFGSFPSDDPSIYLKNARPSPTNSSESENNNKSQNKSTNGKDIQTAGKFVDDYKHLQTISKEVISWCGRYSYSDTPPFDVKVWEIISEKVGSEYLSRPCFFYQDGIRCNFFFNPKHPIYSSFPFEPRQLLLIYLAERFKVRDNEKDIASIYNRLTQNQLNDLRVDRLSIQEKAAGVFDQLRERLLVVLKPVYLDVLNCIHESSGEVEETVKAILSDPELLINFQNKEEPGMLAITSIPPRTIIRLVDRFPEYIFDGKVFRAPFMKLDLQDLQASKRAREESKDRLISYLKDSIWILNQSGTSKEELLRCTYSITALTREIVG
jgi:hypothetical protein